MDKSIEKPGFSFYGLNSPTLEVVGSNPVSRTTKNPTFVYLTNVGFFELSVPCGT